MVHFVISIVRMGSTIGGSFRIDGLILIGNLKMIENFGVD